MQNVFSPHIRLTSKPRAEEYEPSSPRRMNEVRRRAREIQDREGIPYHVAMKIAGGRVARAAEDGTR